MSTTDWITLACCLLGLIGSGVGVVGFALASWSMLQTVRYGQDIRQLQTERRADKEENDRQFKELKTQLAKIERMLVDALRLNRSTDLPG